MNYGLLWIMDCYVEISSFIEILQTILNVNFLSCENWTCWLKKRWMQIAVFDWKSALSPFHSHNYSTPCHISDLVLLPRKSTISLEWARYVGRTHWLATWTEWWNSFLRSTTSAPSPGVFLQSEFTWDHHHVFNFLVPEPA